MPDQVRHDGVRLSNCQVNNILQPSVFNRDTWVVTCIVPNKIMKELHINSIDFAGHNLLHRIIEKPKEEHDENRMLGLPKDI